MCICTHTWIYMLTPRSPANVAMHWLQDVLHGHGYEEEYDEEGGFQGQGYEASGAQAGFCAAKSGLD